MKFLIQKINGEVKYDFAFTLIRAAECHNWLHPNEIIIKYIDFDENIPEPDDILPNPYKLFHGNYVPVGSVEFVTNHLQQFFNLLPKPINVPEELFDPKYSHRPIFNGDNTNIDKLSYGSMAGKAVFVCAINNEKYQQFKHCVLINPEWIDTFDCKMKGSLDNLKKYADNPSLVLRKKLTAQFQGYTKYGIPRFPVGLRFRENI